MKANILALKNNIKSLVEEQKVMKLNRKTVHLPEGFVRTTDPCSATWKHEANRYELRVKYLVYAYLRGKDEAFMKEIDKDWNSIFGSYVFEKYLNEYDESKFESSTAA
jgi:hypothetical protein